MFSSNNPAYGLNTHTFIPIKTQQQFEIKFKLIILFVQHCDLQFKQDEYDKK